MGILLLLVASLGWSFVENFKTSDQLVYRPQNYQRTLDSTVSFGGCSGAFISNHGHILTALHCFQGAYPKFMEQAPSVTIRSWEYGFTAQKVFGPGRQVRPGILRDVYINGVNYPEVEIVYSGARLGLNYLDTLAEDALVLKVPVESKVSCSYVSHRRPISGEILWAYGFPSGFVIRNGQEMGDMDTLKISNGRVNQTIAQGIGGAIDTVKKSDVDMKGFLSSTMEYRKNTYLVSMDVDDGMSGGPVFDKDGVIIGTTAQAVPTLLSSERRRNNIQAVYATVRAMEEHFSDSELDEIFDCNE